jgi:hypothetical protein
MADSIHITDTINGHSYPICFKTRPGQLRPGALSLGDAQDMGTPPAMSELIHQHWPASSYVVLKMRRIFPTLNKLKRSQMP